MAAARADDQVTGRGSSGSSFGDRQIVVAVVLQNFGSFEACALHARGERHRPRLEHNARRYFHCESIGGEFGHLSTSHVEQAAAIFRNVRGIDGVDAEIDGIAPRASRMIGVHDAQAVVRREVNVIAALVLAEIRSPNASVIPMQSRSHGTPVDEIARMPDQQSRCVVEAGVRHEEVVADADRARVRMISAENRVAVGCGRGLRQQRVRRNRYCGRDERGVLEKAAASSHRGEFI